MFDSVFPENKTSRPSDGVCFSNAAGLGKVSPKKPYQTQIVYRLIVIGAIVCVFWELYFGASSACLQPGNIQDAAEKRHRIHQHYAEAEPVRLPIPFDCPLAYVGFVKKTVACSYETIERESLTAVKALIMYEDLVTGLRAKASLDNLYHELECEGNSSTDLWRLDLLGEPLLREMAAIEASAVDIIILSLHGQNGLPGTASDWMDRWLEHKEDRPYALGVLLDSELANQGPDNGVFTRMRQVANLGGADLFCGCCEPTATAMNSFLTELNENTYRSSRVLEDVLEGREPYLWGGLNE